MPNPILAWLRGDDLKRQDRATEQKLLNTLDDTGSVPYYGDLRGPGGMLVHGPGATGILEQWNGMGNDGNSAAFACLMAIGKAFIEPTLKVWRTDAVGERTALPDHALLGLLDRPNPFMSMREIWFWTAWSLAIDGNAYLRKVRSGDGTSGNVVELWPVSPKLIRPSRQNGSRNFIDAYAYHPNGQRQAEPIPVENVVHFKLGIDDRDQTLGLSPFKRLLRHTLTDDEASAFASNLLMNFGIPGLVVIPPKESNLSEEQAMTIKARIQEEFAGRNRGRVGFAAPGSDLKQFGFDPKSMDLKALHQIPEARIAAVLGVPPAVAGLSVGLEQTSNYASFREVREMFTEQTLVFYWTLVQEKLDHQLLSDFTRDRTVSTGFDLSEVRAFAQDEDALWARVTTGWKAGLLTLDQALSELGLPPAGDGGDQRATGGAPMAVPETPAGKMLTLVTKARQDPAEGLPALYAAMLDLAEPSLTRDMDAYFNGQRQRVKRRMLGSA